MKALLKTTALILMACTAMSSCKHNDSPQAPQAVNTVTLKDSSIVVKYHFPATIKGKEDVAIYPQVSGRLTKKCVLEGAKVKKGQVLFEIFDTPYYNEVQMCKAAVETAKALLESARLTFESKNNLYTQDIISEYQLKLAKNEMLKAEANLSQAEANLEIARLNLSYTKVTSPIDGVVGEINYDLGDIVGQIMTKPLTCVSDNSIVHASFSVQENIVLNLEKTIMSMPVKFIMNNGEYTPEEGRILSLSGVISKNTGALVVKAEFPNPDGKMLSGGSGKVELSFDSDNEILVPRSSIKEVQDKKFVFKVDSCTLHQCAIQAERVDAKYWVILPDSNGNKALKAGDVITSSTNRLYDGEQVEVK